ncbi:MAG: hypothetical protein ACXADY_04285 [Candidatus Hodarchaeales archaeon]|jgi:hypothetical protein
MKKYFVFLIIVLSLGTTASFANNTCVRISNQLINDSVFRFTQETADFFLNVSAPENMDYQDTVKIIVEIEELSNNPQNGISLKVELDSGLYFAEDQSGIADLGNFNPRGIKKANFSITASQTKLTNPYVIARVYLSKNGDQQYISIPDSQLETYYAFGINILYPNLRVRGPIELKGFVVPRIEMLPDEKQTVTYNVSNIGESALKNLTFQVETEKEFIKASLLKTSLDILPANNFTLVSLEVSCETMYASFSDLHFLVDSDLFDTRVLILKIQTFDFFNPYKYYNSLVIIAWPIFILFFAGFALFIGYYTWKKRTRRKAIEKELEERYGKSLID